MKMRRSEWLAMQNTDERTRANRKDRPKKKTGLRPYRKDVGSYVDYMKDMLGISGDDDASRS